MPNQQSIKTSRLLLRQWQDSDLKPFAQLNADAEVMKFFPNVLTENESNQMVARLQKIITEKGYGLWAVELISSSEFIGFVGLNEVASDSELGREIGSKLSMINTPFLEIGWRLAKKHWGNGYATEAALAVLDFAFNQLNLNTIYSFTALPNTPSQKVMQRIGMQNTNIEFNHPKLADGHVLQGHCLYKIHKKNVNNIRSHELH